MNRGAHRQQVRRAKKPAGAKRKYARGQDGATEIVGGPQFFCPTCGDSPPNLPADNRIPKPHPAGMLVVDPETHGGLLLCLRCYFRVITNLVPTLVEIDEDGNFKPHYAIPDHIQAMIDAKNAEDPEPALGEEEGVTTVNEAPELVIAR